MLLIRAYKSPVAKAPAKFLHHPSRECGGLLSFKPYYLYGCWSNLLPVVESISYCFFFPLTHMRKQIQAPRLIVYLWVSISFCEFYPSFDLDWLIKILNNLDESIHQSFNQKTPSSMIHWFCVHGQKIQKIQNLRYSDLYMDSWLQKDYSWGKTHHSYKLLLYTCCWTASLKLHAYCCLETMKNSTGA